MPTSISWSRGERRDHFLAGVEAFSRWRPGTPEPIIDCDGRNLTLSQVCGLVWHSTDTFPHSWAEVHEELGCRRRSYAAVARAMRVHIRENV